MNISVVIPLLNEDESLQELYDWIVRVVQSNHYSYEILFIDDGSTDSSWETIQRLSNRDSNVKGIQFQTNYGKSQALNAGFVWGYEGLINNIINKIIFREKVKYKIILTGGYASFFKRIIKKKISIDQDITIKGITKVYKEFI